MTARDVTHRIRRPKQELMGFQNSGRPASERGFEIPPDVFKAIDLLDAAVVDCDENGALRRVNSTAESLFGAENGTEDIVSLITRVHPADRPLLKAHLKDAAAGNAHPVEVRLLRRDQERKHVRCMFRRTGPEGGNLIGTLIDISEQKDLEYRMREFRSAVEQSPVSILLTDTDGNIEYANPRFEEMTGYSREEVRGRNPRFLKSGYTTDEQYKALWENISTGREWRGEFHNRKKNGELYWESAVICPIRNAESAITNYLAVKEDITLRKRIELELIAAKERAERADRLKDAFISNISHEIRTPLNIILGYADIIELELGSRITVEEGGFFQNITRAAKRLTRTVENILNISSVEIGEYVFERKTIDMVAETYQIFMDMRLLAIEKGIGIEFTNECSSVTVEVEPVTFRDALANLIDNAIKFTEEGAVSVNVGIDNATAFVRIADSGVGISEKYMPDLFSPFSQEECGYSRRFDGLGLGLALTKKYLDINGATIEYISNNAGGTTVTVQLTAGWPAT